ncbi:MAG: phage recombination protein Bet [Janthinobacterium lividum]
MTTTLATRPENGTGSSDIVLRQHTTGLTTEQIDLLKTTICKDSTDDELKLFIAVANRTGLDPFSRQIHAVMRWDPKKNKEVMTIQVGIDGLRLIADRTGDYAPGRETEFTYSDDEKLVFATAFVKKWTHGEWHIVSESAHWTEYCQLTRALAPMALWASKPHVMLGKCAEARALRRAFPQETSGVYIQEEMMQQDSGEEAASVRSSRPSPAKKSTPQEEREGLIGAINATKDNLPQEEVVKFETWLAGKGGFDKLGIKGLTTTLQNLVKLSESFQSIEAEGDAVIEGEFTADQVGATVEAATDADANDLDDPFADN